MSIIYVMNVHFFLIVIFYLSPNNEAAEQFIENQQRCIVLEEILNSFIWSETLITDDAASIAYEAIHLDCPCIMQAFNVSGFLDYNKSKYNNAESALNKAEELFYEGKGSTKYFALNQNYLALLEIVKNDAESALFHLKKSKDLAVSINDSLLISFANLNLGNVQYEMGDVDLAEQSWLNALEMKNIHNKIRENDGYAYLNLARVYYKKGLLKKSLNYIKKSKKVWLNLDFKKGFYLTALLEVRILFKNKNYNQALLELQKGRAYGDKAGVSLLKGEYYFLESEIYQNLNDETNEIASLKKALNYSMEFSLEKIEIILDRLTELLNNKEKANMNKLFLTAFKRLKDQNEINARKKISNEKNLTEEIEKKEKGESTIKQQTTFIYILAFFLAILLLLILGIIRQHVISKKLNQKLLASHKTIRKQINLLKQHNKELQNFAYEASHDLKSPLRTINSFAGLLERKIDQQDNAVKQYIQYIQKATKSMTEMITGLLNHSTSEKVITFEKNYIVNLIEEVIQNLQTDIIDNKAQVVYQKNNKTFLYCDKNMFIQLLQNLIGNAINYANETEKPIIQITTKTSPTSFILKVKDNGIGIDEKNHQIIFEMFKRLKVKSGAEGTGIGLATCKKIVDFHKGKISIQSKINKGAVFTVLIPQKNEIISPIYNKTAFTNARYSLA